MRQRTRLVINALASTTARVIALAIRFAIVPFAISIMGRGHYGLWVVVGQIFAYTRILDMGLRSAVSREVALRLGRGEPEKIDRYVNTAAAFYSVVGLLICALTVVLAVYYPHWFEVDPQYHWAVRGMVLCSGLTLACAIAQNSYGAVAAGLQRYDIISGSQIVADVIRAILVFALLGHVGIGWGLILMAVATGGGQTVGAILRTLAGLRLCKFVRFRPWQVDRSLLGGLIAFGVNSVLFMMSLAVGSQLAQILIGACMSTAQATDFSVAAILMVAVHTIVVTFGMSARVVASRYDGESNFRMLRHLLLRSTRYCSLLTMAGVLVLVLFTEALLRLWMGDNYSGAEGTSALESIARTCRVLAIGYGLFWLSLPSFNVVNGMGRHRFPAILAAGASAISMLLVIILASTTGATIDLVAWGVVLPIIPVCGVVLPLYCCRQVHQPVGRYVWEGFAIPALGCLPAGVAAYLFNYYHSAESWWVLGWQLGSFGLMVLVCAWFFVAAAADRSQMLGSLSAFLRRFRHV
ncbi:MAG: MATE family efflux transporter [Planctomycetota bacterium]